MEIQINRHRIREITCDGTLMIDGMRICDTAENSKYRSPVGTYHIELVYNKELGRKVPALIPVTSGCSCQSAFLAIGNGVYDFEDGRIILGTYIVPGCLKNSREPFMQLYDRINNSQRRGHEVILRITES